MDGIPPYTPPAQESESAPPETALPAAPSSPFAAAPPEATAVAEPPEAPPAQPVMPEIPAPFAPVEEAELVELPLHEILDSYSVEQLGFDSSKVPPHVATNLPLSLIKPQLSSGSINLPLKQVVDGCDERFHRAFAQADQNLEIRLPINKVFHHLPAGCMIPAPTAPPEPEIPAQLGAETAQPPAEEAASPAPAAEFETPFSMGAMEDQQAGLSSPQLPVSEPPPVPQEQPAESPFVAGDNTAPPQFPAIPATEEPPAALEEAPQTPPASPFGLPPELQATPAPAPETSATDSPPADPQSNPFAALEPAAADQPATPAQPLTEEPTITGITESFASLPTAEPAADQQPPLAATDLPWASADPADTPTPAEQSVSSEPIAQTPFAPTPEPVEETPAAPEPPVAAADLPWGQPAEPAAPLSPEPEDAEQTADAPLDLTTDATENSAEPVQPEAHADDPDPVSAPAFATLKPLTPLPFADPKLGLKVPSTGLGSFAADGDELTSDELLEDLDNLPAFGAAEDDAEEDLLGEVEEDLTFGFRDDDPTLLTLRAVFETDENIDLEKAVELSGHLPGIAAAVFLDGNQAVASRNPDTDPSAPFVDRAPEVYQSVRGLASAMGMGDDASTFTIRTNSGIMSFFKEGEACLGVLHQNNGFLPGVREKLTLVTKGLAGMALPS